MIELLIAALEGRYTVVEELGEGGMATVFLAQDLRHDRKVALKVLKPELAAVVGADRFLSEIKTTANLQHPHILPLFDSGEADGFLFYVMPYVEGESLREKLDREKQLSVDEAVVIAEKVAAALHYAHEQEVVHRDVKPANILMSRGEPLVADFGIALALSEAGGGRITETGLSLGTPHYMSPEQASGDQSLDKRSDVYALGCVMYEMLTGEPPYGGPTAQSVLAKILTGDARRITELRRTVPVHVDAAVAKALEKLPADRFSSAADFARALDDPTFRHASQVAGALPGRSIRDAGLGKTAITAAVGVTAAAAGLVVGFLLRPEPSPPPAFRVAMELPDEQRFVEAPVGPSIDLSDDGRTLVYSGSAPAGGRQLWVRRADALQATPLPGTTTALSPVVSPAGDAVTFIQGADLKVVDIASGTTRTVPGSAAFVTDWTADDRLVYLAANTNDFFAVPATGGDPVRIPGLSPPPDAPAGATPLWGWGQVLPGGERGVWTRFPESGNLEDQTIAVVDLETGEFEGVARGSYPRYLDSGHLAWVSPEGSLLVASFDPGAGELTGPAIPVAEGVSRDATGAASVGFSRTDELVYRVGSARSGGMKLVWLDRTGDSTFVDPDWSILPISAGNWSGAALSPDGTRLVTTDAAGGGSQLWIKNLEDDTPPYRITFGGNFHVRPHWTPDGQSVTFISNQGGADRPTQVWAQAADGSGSPRLVHAADVEIEEAMVSPDGQWLVYRQGGTTANRDIYALRLGVDTVGRPLAATDADEKGPALSPDGRWVAYTSDETGQPEIFVRPFPEVSGGKWQVSVGGGFSPLWAHNGREIIYFSGDGRSLMAASLDVRESSVSVRGREALFDITNRYVDANYTAFDVDLDDQRFLMYAFTSGEAGSLIWVKNWRSDWRRRTGEER